MAKLIYTAITSFDGYTEDDRGQFEWAQPDDEVHAFANELAHPVGTYLFGRRMYETMSWWETVDTDPVQNAVVHDFAEHWLATDKIVYSRTLEEASTARTRIERDFDPDAIRALKETATADIGIGGPELAGQALVAGLVDEVHLLLNPIIVGSGKPALPDRFRTELELIDEHRFGNGVLHVGYRIAPAAPPTD